MARDLASRSEAAAMRSTASWALLGLLIERPSYGYELLQRFGRVYGEMLPLSGVSRIYEALEDLHNRGLIEEFEPSTADSTTTRQPKLHYRATEKGMRGYQEWLVSHIDEERQRSWLFARQLAMLEPEQALEVIERAELESLQEASTSASDKKGKPSAENGGTGGVARRLSEEDERLALGVRLSWTEYARRQLKALVEERAGKR